MADNKLLAEIARKGGGKLLNAAIDKVLPVAAAVAEEGTAPKKKKTLIGGIAGAMAVRFATRSVPGAIVVGGSLLAKRLYDRRHAAKTAAKAEKESPKA
ncbi:hypothetical protein [Novosphingobium sp.]|uniref:hypothetical protein n=1 Tax=Novosphingobium sp. TaxID=1874826 RepID=UPI0035AF2C34